MTERSSKKFTDFDEDLYARIRMLSRQAHKPIGVLMNESMKLRLEQPDATNPPDWTSTAVLTAPREAGQAKLTSFSITRNHRPTVTLNSKLVWDYMRKNALTDSMLAKKLDISRETLNRILHHKQTIGSVLGLKLTEVTDISYLELFPDSLRCGPYSGEIKEGDWPG